MRNLNTTTRITQTTMIHEVALLLREISEWFEDVEIPLKVESYKEVEIRLFNVTCK